MKNEADVIKGILDTKNQLVKGENNGRNNLMGNGDVFIMSPTVKDMVHKEAVTKFNNQVEEETAKWDERIKDEEQHAKEIDEKMQDMEIIPINTYVLVQPFKKNPFQKMKTTASGILIPTFDGTFQNPDSGEEDQADNLSVQATVIEASPLCKFVKEGDIVYYRRSCGVPIPFFGQGLEVVAEQQIHVVLNKALKERYSRL